MAKVMYSCEYCGELYDSEERANEHEAYHKTAESIVGFEFERNNSKPAKYPDIVKCKMSDGQVVQYYRKR